MKIVFIRPFISGELYEPPLGLAALAAYLRANSSAEILVWDLEVLRWSKERLQQELRTAKPELVCISFMTYNRFEGLEVAELAKREGSTVLVGGQHATAVSEEILRDYPFIDIVVRGEAEGTLLELLNRFMDGKTIDDVKGITFRSKNGMVKNPDAEFVDVNTILMPAWDLFPMTKYKYYAALGSRGCPYNCHFCGSPQFWKRKLRLRDPLKFVDEIEYLLKTYGKKVVHMKDDVFTADRNWTLNVCEEIKRRNLEFKWECLTRVNLVDEELLRTMRDTGCQLVEFGVETGNDRLMVQISKGQVKSQARAAVSAAKHAGIRVGTFFMVGHPGETEETLEETFDFAFELRADCVSFTPTYIIPGTELYNTAVRNGVLPAGFSWSQRTEGPSGYHMPIYENPGLPESKIHEYRRRFLMRFALSRLFDIRDKKDYDYLFRDAGVLYNFSIYNFKDLASFLNELRRSFKRTSKGFSRAKGLFFLPAFTSLLVSNHAKRLYNKITS